jgi:DNA polymerase-3 subunit alpha
MIEKIGKVMQDRLSQVCKSPFYLEEAALLNNVKVLSYYKDIYENVNLDPANTKNSYIMWCLGKVDTLDRKKPASINGGTLALCDIDVDVPRKKRHLVIEYLINKYGKPSVCQMITYFELQGRSALNLVLRFTEARDASEAHKITELLPEKSKVEDQMVAVGEKSLIKWTLENLPNRLSQYARIEDGKIVGDLAKEFEQAIRLEGTIVGSGKHASAVIVYDGTISDVCPMTRDKSSDELIGALDMGDSEQVGLVKLDVLGLATLDKLMIIKELVEAKNEQT